MKGLVVPSNKTSLWWNTKLETLVDDTINGNVFFENLFFDQEEEQVHLHLLIPTQFGIMLNKKRNEMIYKAVKKFMIKNKHLNDITVKSLMLFQESFMISCVICRGVCYVDTTKPYQMCLRVIGGFKTPPGTWRFEYVFQVFCRSCQSQPWHALMLFDANHGYDAFINALQFLNVHRKFRSDDVIGPAFLKRIAFLNQVIPAFIKLLHRDVAVTCQHCGKHENTVEPCKGCQSIFFCVDGKHKDKRLVDTELENKPCCEIAEIYHKHWLCLQLQKEQLFHLSSVLYVLPDGKVEIAEGEAEGEEELVNNDD